MNLPGRNRRPERGGFLIRLMLGLVLLLVVAVALGIWMLPGLLAARISARTGFGVTIDAMSVNPFTARVTIKGLVVKNPAGWPEADFIDVREFRAGANLFSLLGRRPVADEVVLDIAQITLVRDQRGEMNATLFKEGLAGAPAAAGEGPDHAATGTKTGGKPEFLIKHLILRFDRLVLADFSGAKPVTKEYPLNIRSEMSDVDSVAKLLVPLQGRAIGLATESLGGLFKNNPDLLKGMPGTLQEEGRKVGKKLQGLLDSLDKRKP